MVQRVDRREIVRLDARTVLGDGAERIPARLTRTGVFLYSDGQGGEFRELRLPEEVFSEESLDSLRAVTVVEGHPAYIDPDNWKALASGHVGDNVHQDGIYVAADLVIKDGNTQGRINKGELVELSCGYTVDLELASGEYEGEPYDAIQRNIRYNHVGLGPEGWGRAGSNVRLMDGRLDTSATSYEDATYATAEDMQPKIPASISNVQKTDAPAGPVTAPKTDTAELEALRAERDQARADLAAAREERDALRLASESQAARADKAEGERDALKSQLETARSDSDPAKIDAKVKARVELVTKASAFLSTDKEPYKFDGKTDHDIRVDVIKKADPNFDAKDKAPTYVEARFDMVVADLSAGRASVAEVNTATAKPDPDAGVSIIDQAAEKMLERHANAWKARGGNK